MPRMTRRSCVAGATAAAAIAVLPRRSFGAQAFRLVVTTTETPVLPNSVMELADTLGYFRREGVQVEIIRVQQTPSAVAALVSGQGQMANISVDSALQLTARKQVGLKAVLSPNKSFPYIVVGKSSIATVTDLARKTFGVGRVGSLDHSLSTMVLGKYGVDERSLRFVSIGQPNVRAQALAAGRIDATTVSLGVWLGIAEREGLKVLVHEPEYHAAAPVLNKVNVVTDGTLRARGAEVAAVARALVLASRDFARDPMLWITAMESARPDVPRADLLQLATAFRRSWSVNGGLNRAEIEFTVDWNYRTQDFRDLRRPALAEWVDFELLRGVLNDIGIDPDQDVPLHS
jgi:NitT/TauT family transport system substrate-binding protein